MTVLTGSGIDATVPPDVYRRRSIDLRANDVVVVADLPGPSLDAVLEGGALTALKVSDGELPRDGRLTTDNERDLISAIEGLHKAGADHVIATRGPRPTLALIDDELVEIESPPPATS